jgi:hypothetical protein
MFSHWKSFLICKFSPDHIKLSFHFSINKGSSFTDTNIKKE